ncbi:MAG: hypothetical protein ABIL58_00675 [Pseudomonadota bacterium]
MDSQLWIALKNTLYSELLLKEIKSKKTNLEKMAKALNMIERKVTAKWIMPNGKTYFSKRELVADYPNEKKLAQFMRDHIVYGQNRLKLYLFSDKFITLDMDTEDKVCRYLDLFATAETEFGEKQDLSRLEIDRIFPKRRQVLTDIFRAKGWVQDSSEDLTVKGEKLPKIKFILDHRLRQQTERALIPGRIQAQLDEDKKRLHEKKRKEKESLLKKWGLAG